MGSSDGILVTGGAGFIGSTLVRLLRDRYPSRRLVVLDAITYAGARDNIDGVEDVEFVRGDIVDSETVRLAMRGCDTVFNLAAETHVDRSIVDAQPFVRTNVLGVQVILEAARTPQVRTVVHASTDEVYGSLAEGSAAETTALSPSNPYAATKAAGDMLCRAAFFAHGTDVRVVRGVNTYGPRQYPEKAIPLFTVRALAGEPVPVYGDGSAERDWLYVDDHARALITVLEAGAPGGVYNAAAHQHRTVRQVADSVLDRAGDPRSQVLATTDRPGHDARYALDDRRLRELGWSSTVPFDDGMDLTVDWYRSHDAWIARRMSGSDMVAWVSCWYSGRTS
jgi:dTDP-glucose 4,6-dehydratase